MNRGIKIALWCVIAVVLWVGAGLGAITLHRHFRFGAIHTQAVKTITADRGDRFSIAVRDLGGSVGDHWTQSVQPGTGLRFVEDHMVPASISDRVVGPAMGGGGGTRYFVYEADAVGTWTITLSNCFQGCMPGRDDTRTGSVAWTVTVD